MWLIDQMYINMEKKAVHVVPYPSIGPKLFWVGPKSFALCKTFLDMKFSTEKRKLFGPKQNNFCLGRIYFGPIIGQYLKVF